MILYFDNYITDAPIYSGGHLGISNLRNSCKNYNMSSKLHITMYTLASYTEIKWSNVVIKYELENINQKREFEKFVKRLFPKAIIIYGRSDSQKKFQESVNILKSLKDEWIFYAGNNDHPFIAPNTKTLLSCMEKAKEYGKKYRFVSVAISHFSEFLNKPRKGTPFHEIHHHDSKIIEENKDCIISFFPRGLNHSMMIANIDLFHHWFFSGNSKGALVRRSEDMEPFIKVKNQILIIPKKELCAHFDGEFHTEKTSHNLYHDLIPPLFIPPGFFEKKIKISFGYNEYREGWVNINPLKEKYSFRDNVNGTDLKIGLQDIPLFWKERIKKIDVNPKLDLEKTKEALRKRKNYLENPFPKKSQAYYSYYRFKNKIFTFLHNLSLTRAPIKHFLNKSLILKNFQIKLVKIRFR